MIGSREKDDLLLILIALVLGCLSLLIKDEQMPHSYGWEYKILQISDLHNDEKTLNELGAQGWELITILEADRNRSLYLRRAK